MATDRVSSAGDRGDEGEIIAAIRALCCQEARVGAASACRVVSDGVWHTGIGAGRRGAMRGGERRPGRRGGNPGWLEQFDFILVESAVCFLFVGCLLFNRFRLGFSDVIIRLSC